MAIAALTLSSVKNFESVLDSAKGTPDATVFVIGALDAFVSTFIYDSTLFFTDGENGAQAAQVKMNQANLEAVRFGLKGWTNFKDAKGSDVEFKTVDKIVMGKKYTVVADECLVRLDLSLVRELANAVRNINDVSKEDLGKSVAAS